MEALTRWSARGLAAVAVVLSGAFITPLRPAVQQAGRPECPHDWDLKTGQFDEVHPITDIPEFHDCQRFLAYDPLKNQFQYDSLFAIFAVSGLGHIEGSLDSTARCRECRTRTRPERTRPDRRFQPLRFRATTLAVVAARIYAEGIYRPLGIARMYDCLYLFRSDTSWGAIMVPVAQASSACDQPFDPAFDVGVELEVRRIGRASAPAAYPAVARWDWDSAHAQQYIGLTCGSAWCEIGEPGFVPSPLPQLDPSLTTFLGDRASIKGWYDEQILAVLDDDGRTVPGLIRGRVFPAAGIERASFSTWTLSALIVLDTVDLQAVAETLAGRPTPSRAHEARLYQEQMNLDSRVNSAASIAPEHLNTIELCKGSAEACGVDTRNIALHSCDTDPPWWARIRSAGGRVAYSCVTRREHLHALPQFPVPPTARWRWRASDEGEWNACGQGCCETLGPGG
jgi:hypothetical protein